MAHDKIASIGQEVGLSMRSLDSGTDRMIDSFQSAVQSGNTADIRVELDALQQYYAQLWEFHDRLEQVMDTTRQGNAEALETQGVLADRYGGRQIDGLVSAVITSRHIARGHHTGLFSSVASLRNRVTKNLNDVYAAYASYVESDDVSTNELRQTGMIR